MAVLQMTRAEYEKKYGVAPVASKVDTTPAIPKMTRAEYEVKYGLATPTEPTTTKIGMLNIDKTKNPFTVSNPLTDIQAAGEDVNAAITGTGKYEGQGAIRRGTSAAATAAMAIPTVVADVIPGGKTAFDLIGKGFEGAINTAGNIGNILADAAQKVGVMSPEQRKLYDKRNADFVNSPEGVAIESVASVAKNVGDVANVILMAAGTAREVQNFVDKKIPEIKQKMAEKPPPPPSAVASQEAQRTNLVQQQANEIAQIESRYAKGRKANLYSKDEGASSRTRIAETGVLKNSVDENGMVRTTHQGGAVDQYKAMTTKPAEGVVRANLVREGNRVNLSEVQSELTRQINNSGLQGADLVNALNGIKKEIAGLRLKADSLGYVDTTLLHDAKINTTNNINYQTPPETATYRKAVARGYRTLVEENSSFDVKGINAELAKYYDDIARLERLDGARVQSGRLGKYTAQITGTIAGGAIGGLFGGIGGAAVGTIVGGEVAGLIKGKAMSRAITEVPGKAPKSPILEKAMAQSSEPKSLGQRNLSQSINPKKSNTSITPNTTTIPPELQPLATDQITVADTIRYKALSAEYKALPKDQILTWSKLPEYKTLWKKMTTITARTAPITPKVENIPPDLQPLAAEARKYKSAEAFAEVNTKTLYRGTTSKEIGSIPKEGLSVSLNPAIAQNYAKSRGIGGFVDKQYISPSAKTIKLSDVPNEVRSSPEGTDFAGKAAIWARKQGYDVLDMTAGNETEMRVLNKDVLISRAEQQAELKSLYTGEQIKIAGIPKELHAAFSDVHNYKTVEDFLKAKFTEHPNDIWCI